MFTHNKSKPRVIAEKMISEGEPVASAVAAGVTIASRSDSSASMEDDNTVASNQNNQ